MISLINNIFLNIVNMSFTASIVAMVVIVARVGLKKAPKKFSYYLWSVVALRLILPVSFSTAFSLFNLKKLLNFGNRTQEAEQAVNKLFVPAGLEVEHEALSVISSQTVNAGLNVSGHETAESIGQLIVGLLPCIWILGMLFMAIYSCVRISVLSKKLSFATRVKGNVYAVEGFSSPFIFGLARPRIYLPYSFLDEDKEEDREMVLSHERSHLIRKDHWVKALAFVLLSVYWFNPFIWLAFYLMNKDMAMSCDEKVVEKLESTKGYSYALLNCACAERFPLPSPVSFAESSIKSRVRNLISYKKRSKAFSLLTSLLVVILLVACGSDSKADVTESEVISASAPVLAEKKTETFYESENPYFYDIEGYGYGDEDVAPQDTIVECSAENVEYSSMAIDNSAPSGDKSPEYIQPVSPFVITASYGEYSNGESQTIFHYGIDIACTIGSEVLALCDGKIVFAEKTEDMSLRVIVEQKDGYYVVYDHLSEIKAKLGDDVKEGECIALSGQTGAVTGPCLHIEILARYEEAGKMVLKYVEPVFKG